MRSPVQTETSGITEVVSGHLYKITKELMDLDTSNTISKEQFRQLCDRHCLTLTNDQVKPENRLLPLIFFQCIITESIQRGHLQQLSLCFQAETTHAGISPRLQMRE